MDECKPLPSTIRAIRHHDTLSWNVASERYFATHASTSLELEFACLKRRKSKLKAKPEGSSSYINFKPGNKTRSTWGRNGINQGKAVQVEPMKSKLKAPGTERLKRKYDNPLSRFGFKCNLCRYTKGQRSPPDLLEVGLVEAEHALLAGERAAHGPGFRGLH